MEAGSYISPPPPLHCYYWSTVIVAVWNTWGYDNWMRFFYMSISLGWQVCVCIQVLWLLVQWPLQLINKAASIRCWCQTDFFSHIQKVARTWLVWPQKLVAIIPVLVKLNSEFLNIWNAKKILSYCLDDDYQKWCINSMYSLSEYVNISYLCLHLTPISEEGEWRNRSTTWWSVVVRIVFLCF